MQSRANIGRAAVTALALVGALVLMAWISAATKPRERQCLVHHLALDERERVVQVCDHWAPEYVELDS